MISIGAARAQAVKPWTPPSADSLTVWAAQARALFRAQATDSVGADNLGPYEIVGNMARGLIRSLGSASLIQATAIEPLLDSLGLETAVRVDPELPHFVLVSVRNPIRRSAMAIGFVFWFRGRLLHEQGSLLASGSDPSFRVWYTGQSQRPYSACILDRTADGHLSWVVLGLRSNGDIWDIVQAADRPGEAGRGTGAFADVNGDGLPELVLWTRAPVDSLLTLCPECPGVYDENILVSRAEGFELQDSRRMTTPVMAFSLFLRYLQRQDRAGAARLLADPQKLDAAIALGWGQNRARGSWSVEYAEPGENWPRWLAIRQHGAKEQLYIVHFTQKEGRWVIRDWVPVRAQAPPPPGAPKPAAGGTR